MTKKTNRAGKIFRFLSLLVLLSVLIAVFVFSYTVQKPQNTETSFGAFPGDCDNNGFVNIIDFQLLSNSFAKVSGQFGYDGRCDFNSDNVINILDFQILSNNFGRTSLPTNTTTINPTPNPGGRFMIANGKILNPQGQEFVVKGVTSVYGTFCGGDARGYGQTSFINAGRDFDRIKALGINTIRIFTAIPGSSYYNSNYSGYYGSIETYKSRLNSIVTLGRSKNLIIYLSPCLSDSTLSGVPQSTLDWLAYISSTYKNDPYVWIGSMNEPNCQSEQTNCYNWTKWQSDHLKYVSAIRNTGNTAPIVINTISWSSDLSKMHDYPLADNNLIYGVHRYGNDSTSLTSALISDYNNKWANLSANSPFAMIIDEVGAYNGSGFLNSITWVSEFIDFVTNWVNTRGGDGAIAFNWYWSDRNTLTVNNTSETQFTQWGNIFNQQFLRIVR